MSNSPLVCYTKISPNQSGKRKYKITRITPHCIVGQLSVESACGWFAQTNAKSSSNYVIGTDGRIGMAVEESCRSWCSSSGDNDNRAVTIECASAMKEPFEMNENVYNSLIDLCVDICKRNGKTKLLWFADKNKTLNYQPKDDEMLLTVHRWFANKSCPGNWLYARLGDLAKQVTERLEDEDMTQEKFNEMMNTWINTQAAREETGEYSAEARKWAESNGFIQGDVKGRKMYKKFITREEMITIIYRIIKKLGLT